VARGRVITPDFWSDGNMVGVSAFARLFYIGMWNFAHCDKGHLDDDAMGLKLKILPADHVDPQELLAELTGRDRVTRLRADNGKTFLFIPTFARWQKADPRWKTRCPACALINSGELNETPVSLVEHSQTLPSSALREEERTREKRTEENQRGVIAERDDINTLCNLLADLIAGNGSNRPTVTNAWLTDARLLLDKDGRELEAASRLMRWCQEDSFWRSNILSMPKFRSKYDQLRLAANSQQASRKQTPTERAQQTLTLATEIDMKGIGQ
jgi:hypothetical protein